MTEFSTQHATFTIERVYEASPKRVFAAWADPAARDRWFVQGDGWEIAEYSQDFRVGGREHGRFRFKGGQLVHNETQFFDIVPEQRIVFAYSMGFGEKPFSASLSTVELKAEGQATRLIFTEQAVFFEGGDSADQRKAGWTQLLDKFGAEILRSA